MSNFGAPFPILPNTDYAGAGADVVIYVHKDTGDDAAGKGTLAEPFQSVNRAALDIGVPQTVERQITIQLQQTTPGDPWLDTEAAWALDFRPDFDFVGGAFGNAVRVKGAESALGPGNVTVNAVAANATNPTLLDLTVDEDLTGVSIVSGRSYVSQDFGGDFLTSALAIDNGGAVGTHIITVKDPSFFFFPTQALRFFESTTVVESAKIAGRGWVVQGVTFRSNGMKFVNTTREANGAQLQGCGFEAGGPNLIGFLQLTGVGLNECQWTSGEGGGHFVEPEVVSEMYFWPTSVGAFFVIGTTGGRGTQIRNITLDVGANMNFILEGGNHEMPFGSTFFEDSFIACSLRAGARLDDGASWYTDGCTRLGNVADDCLWVATFFATQPAGQTHTIAVFEVTGVNAKVVGLGPSNLPTTHSGPSGSDVIVNGKPLTWAELPETDLDVLSLVN